MPRSPCSATDDAREVDDLATKSSKSRVPKNPSPQQRAIAKKRALFRRLQSSGLLDFDEKNGEYFDRLSDAEWTVVWKRVRAASAESLSVDEAHIRELVDDAAMSSGWFAEFGGELHFFRRDYLRFAETYRVFLKKVQTFRQEMVQFFGTPPDDHKDPYDPWEWYRPVASVLDRLVKDLEREIAERESNASRAESPPNAAQLELDARRARLVTVWQNECGLPVANTKQLRGFLIAALQPYMPRAELTDTMAKHFIKRWLAGTVKQPGFSYFDFNGPDVPD
jgi:hypothetical protein